MNPPLGQRPRQGEPGRVTARSSGPSDSPAERTLLVEVPLSVEESPFMPIDDLADDWDPTDEELEQTLLRTMRRLGAAPQNPQEDDTPFADEAPDFVTNMLRRSGLLPSPPPIDRPHPLASAGLRLKDLRGRSGWTVEEIAERIGMSADLLTAFENGDSAAACKLTRSDLERLASACCGTLADLLGAEHSWAEAADCQDHGDGSFMDPCG